MNAKNIESKFAAMGARMRVREIPSRWRMGDRRWINPTDFAVDIRRDGAGEFFELRVPTHLSDSLDVTVMQSEPKQRHLLLAARGWSEAIASNARGRGPNMATKPSENDLA